MDKPTLPEPVSFSYDIENMTVVKGFTKGQVIAHGEAMAAWGAAQERERIKILIEQQRGLGYHDDYSDQHLGHDNLVDTLVLLLSAHQGD